MNDSVNHPPHYNAHPSGVECIDITEHMNFCLGNALKYIWRADLKNGVEDLRKARWYLDREIMRRQGTPARATNGITPTRDRGTQNDSQTTSGGPQCHPGAFWASSNPGVSSGGAVCSICGKPHAP